MDGRKVDAALAWAAKGFCVFPLLVGDTKPAIEDWPSRASNDPDVIREMWGEREHNIGVHCDGFEVVDADVKHGKDGLFSFMELGYEVETLTVRTPSGGCHFYYRGPNVQNSVEKIGPGLDVRSARGYVIAPGSETAVGRYELITDAPVAEAPADLTARAGAPHERAAPAVAAVVDQAQAVLRGVAWLRDDAPLAIEGQGGDETAFKVAARLKDFGLLFPHALAALAEHWNSRCQPPWTFEDLKQKVVNAYSYGSKNAGADDPTGDFAGLDLPPVPDVEKAEMQWIAHGDAFLRDVAWLYHNALPAVGVCILTAPSGAGKTFLALHLARSLATGDPWFEITPDDLGATILLAAEGQGSIGRRMAALPLPEGAPARLPIEAGMIGYLGQRGAVAALQDQLRVKADKLFRETGLPVRLIVLDTLSASGLLDDENDNARASAAIKALDMISRDMRCLVIVIHHPPKEGKGVGGAGALGNRADYVLEATKGGGTIRELILTKSRDSEQRPLGTFQLEAVQVGEDGRGRPVMSCVVITGAPLEHSQRAPNNWAKFSTAGQMAFNNGTTATDTDLMAAFIVAAGPAAHKQYAKCKGHAITTGLLTEFIMDGETAYQSMNNLSFE